MTAAKLAKLIGFKSLNEVVELTGESRQNLNNMFNNRPKRYEFLLKGAMIKRMEAIEK